MNQCRSEEQVLGREEKKTVYERVINLKIINFRKLRLKTAGNKEYMLLECINSKYA